MATGRFIRMTETINLKKTTRAMQTMQLSSVNNVQVFVTS